MNIPWRNIIILTLLLFLSSIWVIHHLGTSEIYVLLIAAVPGFLKMFDWLTKTLGIEEDNPIKQFIQRILRFLLKKQVLITYSVVLVITGLFVSSLTITAENINSEYNIEITTHKNELSEVPAEIFRERFNKLFLTYPGGRAFDINISGYRQKSVRIQPIVGKKIQIKRDFEPLPSILFRLKKPDPSIYKDDILYVVHKNDTLTRVKHKPESLSFQIGRREEIDEQMKAAWNLELTGLGLAENLRSSLILGWSSPACPDDLLRLNPGDSLSVFILNHLGKAKGRADIIVEKGAQIQEVLL